MNQITDMTIDFYGERCIETYQDLPQKDQERLVKLVFDHFERQKLNKLTPSQSKSYKLYFNITRDLFMHFTVSYLRESQSLMLARVTSLSFLTLDEYLDILNEARSMNPVKTH